MTISQTDVDSLVTYCRDSLGDKTLWITPDGYPNSLALCLIDSIYSTGSHYSSVVNVVNRYRATRGHNDGASALLESISAAGGPREWARTVAGNMKPANTKEGAPLKAEVIQSAAELMVAHGVDTVEGLVAAVRDNPRSNPIHDAWKKLPSQGSGVTYSYLLLLAGLPSVKPDRMVRRFLQQALGVDAELTTDHAIELIMAAAGKLEVSPRTLDHVIWRAASGRELTNQTPQDAEV